MTRRRQEINERRNEIVRIVAPGTRLAVALHLAVLLSFPVVMAARAATTERLVVDHVTGLAIGGIDPVAYFTDGAMQAGSPDFEAAALGAVWRFRNADNRSFFLAAPDIYAPQFGGYDPIDVARGVAVPGVPRLWLVYDKRLYLFSREDARDAFARAPEQMVHSAVAAWPALRDTLAE
jgi:hypothetical protein